MLGSPGSPPGGLPGPPPPVDAAMPKGWAKDPKLERFRGFCNNLRTKPPGEDVFLENREQLLSQYVYPGLSEAGVHRSAYPAAAYPELAALKTSKGGSSGSRRRSSACRRASSCTTPTRRRPAASTSSASASSPTRRY